MRARWNANTVLLTVFVLILVGAGVDYGRRVLGGDANTEPPPQVSKRPPSSPDFDRGDLAPDFKLPDVKKKEHKLSELVKGKTLLFFACGCSNCRKVQALLAKLRKRNEAKVPPVITITSAPPESQLAWLRDTGLPQTMLYWHQGVSPDPMTIYRGKPCPRLFVLNADRTVKYIGPSMSEMPGTEGIEIEIARELDPSFKKDDKAVQRLMQTNKSVPIVPDRKLDLPPYAQGGTP